jgi:SAM-dependent methyltransferase
VDRQLPDSLWNVLACPGCGSSLHRHLNNLECSTCKTEYSHSDSGGLDLRLKRPKTVVCELTLGTPLHPSDFSFRPLAEKRHPEVDFSATDVPSHLSRELLSHFPKAQAKDSIMLDLGCGDAVHRGVCEYAGFQYVGVDYDTEGAPIFGDAHALPFCDRTFDFVMSIAVLEHIRFPNVMMREACRVLKPGGMFIGTVAFLEPYHQNSFYHHTHLGTYNSLKEGGFIIECISPSVNWSVLKAQARMGLFPRMPAPLSTALIAPLELVHKLWWRVGSYFNPKASEEVRLRTTTGSFSFIARRPA